MSDLMVETLAYNCFKTNLVDVTEWNTLVSEQKVWSLNPRLVIFETELPVITRCL